MTAALHAPPETKDETIALKDHRERLRATTFVWMTPAAILLIGLFLIPTIYAIYLGFTNLQLLGPHAQNYSFTGLANFNRLVNDPVFWYSVKLTLVFVIVSGIIAQTLLGLGLALLGQRAHFTVRAIGRLGRHPGLGPARDRGGLHLVLVRSGGWDAERNCRSSF